MGWEEWHRLLVGKWVVLDWVRIMYRYVCVCVMYWYFSVALNS